MGFVLALLLVSAVALTADSHRHPFHRRCATGTNITDEGKDALEEIFKSYRPKMDKFEWKTMTQEERDAKRVEWQAKMAELRDNFEQDMQQKMDKVKERLAATDQDKLANLKECLKERIEKIKEHISKAMWNEELNSQCSQEEGGDE